jgi:hypothetical protein
LSKLRKPTKRHPALGQTPVAVLEHGTAAMMVDRRAGFVDYSRMKPCSLGIRPRG